MKRLICVVLVSVCSYAGAQCTASPVDADGNFVLSISELLQPIQYFNIGGYHCDVDGEGGYAAGLSAENDCPPLSFDLDADFVVSVEELLQVIQFYNSLGYHCQVGDSDGYGPGLSENGDISIISFEAANGSLWDVGASLPYILKIRNNTNLPSHDLAYYHFEYSEGWDFVQEGYGYGTHQEVTTLSHKGLFLTPGIKTVTVTVDPDNLIEETDETNNSVTLTIEVTDAANRQN